VCNRLPVLKLALPYNLPPYFLPSYILLLISITYFYYLSPTKWRCLRWRLWIIVVIFLLPPRVYIETLELHSQLSRSFNSHTAKAYNRSPIPYLPVSNSALNLVLAVGVHQAPIAKYPRCTTY